MTAATIWVLFYVVSGPPVPVATFDDLGKCGVALITIGDEPGGSTPSHRKWYRCIEVQDVFNR